MGIPIIGSLAAAAAEEVAQLTPVITSREELDLFLAAVEQGLGDPSASTCLVFIPFGQVAPSGQLDMKAAWLAAQGTLVLDFSDGNGIRSIPMAISPEAAEVGEGGVETYHARKVCAGVWALAPSLHIPGVIHAFIVLHGVPEPAPWEQRIVLAGA